MGAFGCGDKLNHLLRAAEPVLDALSVGPESFGSQLGGNTRVGETSILGDEPDFVHANAGSAALPEILLQAFGQRAGPSALSSP